MEWRIYVDGTSAGNPGESGAGMVITVKVAASLWGKHISGPHDQQHGIALV